MKIGWKEKWAFSGKWMQLERTMNEVTQAQQNKFQTFLYVDPNFKTFSQYVPAGTNTCTGQLARKIH